ncbi:hypothetical protein [Haloactinospora alba]|nr:hypothetical protein [Haloactinospora alba]
MPASRWSHWIITVTALLAVTAAMASYPHMYGLAPRRRGSESTADRPRSFQYIHIVY